MRLDISLRHFGACAFGAVATFALWTPVAAWSAPLDPNSRAGAGISATQITRDTLPTVGTTPSRFNGSIADSNGDRFSDDLGARLANMKSDTKLAVIVSFTGPAALAAGRSAAGQIQINHEFSRIHAFSATMTAAQARTPCWRRAATTPSNEFEPKHRSRRARRSPVRMSGSASWIPAPTRYTSNSLMN
jgi:hypothetical protein